MKINITTVKVEVKCRSQSPEVKIVWLILIKEVWNENWFMKFLVW